MQTRSDKAYIAKREKEGRFQLGDEATGSIACSMCKRMFPQRFGDYRDLREAGQEPRCSECIEREARYRDYVAARPVQLD